MLARWGIGVLGCMGCGEVCGGMVEHMEGAGVLVWVWM